MPTYKNRTGVITTFGEYQFAPFEKKQINRNIYTESPVVQLDKNPEYVPYKLLLQNAINGSECDPFIHNHSLVIRIDDKFPEDFYIDSTSNINADNSTLELGVYATIGQYDIKNTYQLIRIIPFTKKYGNWIANEFGSERIPQMLIDTYYEVIYLKVLSFSGSSVDISVKPY